MKKPRIMKMSDLAGHFGLSPKISSTRVRPKVASKRLVKSKGTSKAKPDGKPQPRPPGVCARCGYFSVWCTCPKE